MTTLFVSAETLKVLLKLKNLGNLKNVVTYDLLDSETQNFFWMKFAKWT